MTERIPNEKWSLNFQISSDKTPGKSCDRQVQTANQNHAKIETISEQAEKDLERAASWSQRSRHRRHFDIVLNTQQIHRVCLLCHGRCVVAFKIRSKGPPRTKRENGKCCGFDTGWKPTCLPYTLLPQTLPSSPLLPPSRYKVLSFFFTATGPEHISLQILVQKTDASGSTGWEETSKGFGAERQHGL